MTIKELAELAGVSPATVSLVLNGKKGVSEEKRKEILLLAEENKYQHQRKEDEEAKNILFIKYSKHGKLIEENTGFISGIMDGIEQQCQKRNLNFVVKACDGNLSETLQSISYSKIDGVLVLGTELNEEDYPAVKSIPVPYVVVDNIMPHCDCSSVAIDNEESVFRVIEHYASHGCNKIGYFKSNFKVQNFAERERGFYDACKYFGIEVDEKFIFEVPPTMLGAFEQTQKYIADKREIPDCIFVDNDTMTIGVMKALMIAGYSIPDDVAVIGFDDIPFAEIYSPTISTIHVSKRLLGEMALNTLCSMAHIDHFRNIKLRITSSLQIRQSTR